MEMVKTMVGIHLIIGAAIQAILVLCLMVVQKALRMMGDDEAAEEFNLRNLATFWFGAVSDNNANIKIVLLMLVNIIMWPYQIARGIFIVSGIVKALKEEQRRKDEQDLIEAKEMLNELNKRLETLEES